MGIRRDIFDSEHCERQSSEVFEKIGVLSAKSEAVDARLDLLEATLKVDIGEIKTELKELTAYMHRSKGLTTAMMFSAGLSGGGLAKALSILLSK